LVKRVKIQAAAWRGGPLRGAALAVCLPMMAIVGCGSAKLTVDQKFVVAMVGVFEAPADATGNAEPKYQTYSLEDVSFTMSDGSALPLYTDAAQSFRIVNRSQILFETDISKEVGQTVAAINVQFAATIEGGGKTGATLTATLPSPVLTLNEAFVLEKAQSTRLNIDVQWKNTVTLDSSADPVTEVMSAPTFLLVRDAP
jgi:hypothetical protein